MMANQRTGTILDGYNRQRCTHPSIGAGCDPPYQHIDQTVALPHSWPGLFVSIPFCNDEDL